MDPLAHAAIEIAALAAATVLAALGVIDGTAALAVIGPVAAERVTVAAVAVKRGGPRGGL